MALGKAQAPQTPFERKGPNYTGTYEEIIEFYGKLAAQYPQCKLIEFAEGTDIGKPLHLFVISASKVFHPVPLRQADMRFILINNGIHPGEPDGIESSMMLARDLLSDDRYTSMLEHLVILIIPTYNVDGTLLRNQVYRTNQNGPEEYGFRGNGRNLDLNRDFIKLDSRNAKTFAKMFAEWKPDVFVDTHTSNGADYPYIMTYIATQKDKLVPGLAQYMTSTLNPDIEGYMKSIEMEMAPYVQTKAWDLPPDSGLIGFLETPRYATGFSTLFNAIGYTTESHMLKPFEQRVNGTYHFCLQLLKSVNRDRKIIGRLRKEADEAVKKQPFFTIRWKLDTLPETLRFKGYQAEYVVSAVSGHRRLQYNPEVRWDKNVPFFNRYVAEVVVGKPEAYIIPQAWHEVVDRLKINGIAMRQLSADQSLDVVSYRIVECKPSPNAYEGHHPNQDVKVQRIEHKRNFHSGDYVIFLDQSSNRFIVETLEPQSHDSYFHWNFFDPILSQKEYFSSYVFEKTAQKMLSEDAALMSEFTRKKAEDPAFAGSDYAQLDWLYKRSPHYEPTHLLYPVARLEKNQKLELRK
jgi:hypothetical protein